MMILKVHEDNDKDLPILKETLNRFGLAYDEVNEERTLNKKEKAIYKRLKTSLLEVHQFQEGSLDLKDARDLLDELQG